MNYALLEFKNPIRSWDRVQTPKRTGRKNVSGKKTKKQTKKSTGLFWGKVKALAALCGQTVLIFVLSACVYLGYDFLASAPRFAIQQVRIIGNHSLTEAQLLGWAGSVKEQNIFGLDLGGLTKRLEQHPWVRSVSVERIFPNALQIALLERIPYARIQLDKTFVLDNFGVLLGSAGAAHESLPLILGWPTQEARPGRNVVTDQIIQGLQTMRHFNRLEFFREDPVNIMEMTPGRRIQFTTKNREIKFLISPKSLYEGFNNFKILLDAWEEKPEDVESIDLSFKDRMVVKRRLRESSGDTTGKRQS